MVSNHTYNLTNWRLFAGRLALGSVGMVLAVSVLGAIREWPPDSGQVVLATAVLAALGVALWSARAARGPMVVVCAIAAVVVLVLAFLVGVIGFFEVACWTGHCISFD